MKSLFGYDLAQAVNAPIVDKGSTPFFIPDSDDGSQTMVSIGDDEQILFVHFMVCVGDDVQDHWDVEQDGGVSHDFFVLDKAGQDGQSHGLEHESGTAIWRIFGTKHPG